MATPEAQKAYEEYFDHVGRKARPLHTCQTTGARVIEMLQAAERFASWSTIPRSPARPSGRFRPPRQAWASAWSRLRAGTLFHHYETDEKGLIKKAT